MKKIFLVLVLSICIFLSGCKKSDEKKLLGEYQGNHGSYLTLMENVNILKSI